MKLIILFNGWGMDEINYKDLKYPKDYQLKIVNYPYIIHMIDLKKFEKIIYIGWSFGAYYLSKFIHENKIEKDNIVSINGHGEIIGRYGINLKMLNFTLKTLTPQNLKNFYKNMDIDNNFICPRREFSLIKEELKYFYDNYQPIQNCFTLAFIGRKDRIVPSSKQIKYFNINKIKVVKLEFGHYPFIDKNIIIKVLEEIKYNEF